MIRISAAPINDLASLRAALQRALELEFFTIPPYLTALYSLTGPSRGAQYARSVVKNIVRDEMLHMNLVCNILNAIGGAPDIRAAVPTYPNPLPMAIAGGLTVHIKRYSHALLTDVFMQIEKPETPLDIPTREPMAGAALPPQTIGGFYATIRSEVIRQASDGIFTGGAEKQVTEFFAGNGENIAVTDRDTAVLAIDTIVEQGEGTLQAPTDLQNDIAHYYRFQELAKGMQLTLLPSPHFDPAKPITIDDNSDVIQMVDDPRLMAIDPADAALGALADQCDRDFSGIVDSLHAGFNGDPAELAFIDDVMRGFGRTVGELMQKTFTAGPAAGQHAGPRFLYTGP
jgi:hypothetical protein